MNARILLTATLLCGAAFGFAGDDTAKVGTTKDSTAKVAVPSPKERLAQWQRDQEMIEKFVEGAIQISAENDPLERASHCNVLAAALAKELRKATRQGEAERAAELGDMLQGVLVKGIADNLDRAAAELPPEAPRVKEILQFGAKMADVAGPLEQTIKELPKEKLAEKDVQSIQSTYQALIRAIDQVNSSSQGKSMPKSKGKGKGKKF